MSEQQGGIDMNTLNFQDLVILKQFIEKGFRENFFSQQEQQGASMELKKLQNIIQQVMDRNKKDNKG